MTTLVVAIMQVHHVSAAKAWAIRMVIGHLTITHPQITILTNKQKIETNKKISL